MQRFGRNGCGKNFPFPSSSNLFGVDQQLIDASYDCRTRVLYIADGNLLNTVLQLPTRIREFFDSRSLSMTLVTDAMRVFGREVIKNNLRHLETIVNRIHAAQIDRRNYMLVIGGSAVLNAVRFAARIAHHRICLVRIPTTTRAQADSGGGVENSVNLQGQKN